MTRAEAPPLRPDDIEAVVARVCFPERDDECCPGRVGLELERFPVRQGDEGGAAGRLTIDGPPPSSASIFQEAALHGRVGPRRTVGDLPAFAFEAGGHVTFEPGGQIEHVGLAHRTARAALDEVEAVGALIAEEFDDHGAVVASAGLDVWNSLDSVPLQLDCYRYPAMDAYLAARSPLGRVMMRHTCSLQVNLDLGPASDRRARWLLANVVAPVVTATFANSPGAGFVSERARAWQALDPTRTGFPARLVDGSTEDPVAQMAAAARSADVLLVRTGPATGAPGAPGWTFADWIDTPHPDYGAPGVDDLEYHLSTIFHEVRPRGMLEFRGIDALPRSWRSVPVTLLTGALEDPRARDQLLGLLERHRRQLPDLWRRAAGRGVGDPSFCALAVEAWSYALEGAARLPAGYLPAGALDSAEAFLETFTLRGRCPSDDLRDRLADSPAAALAWAAEPVPQRSRRRP